MSVIGNRYGGQNINPKSISNLFAWYDASDSGSVSRSGFGAGTVSQWNDLSGNARHLVSGVGSETGYTAAAQNGLNAVTGNGSTSFMSVGSSAIYGADYTIIAASKSIQADRGDLIGTGAIASGNILLMNPFSDKIRAHNFMNSGTSHIDSVTSTPPNVNRIVGQMLSGAQLSVIVKGAIDASITLGGAPGTPSSTLIVGSRTGGVGGFNFDGNIYEIVIYTKALTPAELTAVYSYLRNKWAIST